MKTPILSWVGHSTGKKYFEIEVISLDVLTTGIAEAGITRSYPASSIGTEGMAFNIPSAIIIEGIYSGLPSTPITGTWYLGGVIQFAVDFTASDRVKVWHRVDTHDWRPGTDPASGTGYVGSVIEDPPVLLPPAEYKISILTFKELTPIMQVRLRTKAGTFLYEPPAGFDPWE
jgi:hypothetical protein